MSSEYSNNPQFRSLPVSHKERMAIEWRIKRQAEDVIEERHGLSIDFVIAVGEGHVPSGSQARRARGMAAYDDLITEFETRMAPTRASWGLVYVPSVGGWVATEHLTDAMRDELAMKAA